jgi:hypothetical protein
VVPRIFRQVAYCLCDMSGEKASDGGGQRQVAPVIRAGCLTLALLGVVSLFLAVPAILNSSGVRCSLARTLIEDANTDDKKFNDVDTGGPNADDLSCDEAVPLAEQIRRDEDSDKTVGVPSEGLIRNRGLMSAIAAGGQIFGGFMTMGTLQRRWRTVALVFTVVGVVVPVLGLVSVAALGFVVYAIGFSNAAKALWPPGPRLGPDFVSVRFITSFGPCTRRMIVACWSSEPNAARGSQR